MASPLCWPLYVETETQLEHWGDMQPSACGKRLNVGSVLVHRGWKHLKDVGSDEGEQRACCTAGGLP